MLSRAILIFLTGLLCYSSIAQNRIYVDADNAMLPRNGSSWTTAYKQLQDALSLASTGDTILVAEGKYYPHPNDRTESFILLDSVLILGGFDPSSGITELKDRDWKTYKTILDGDIGVVGDSTDNSYHVVEGDMDLTSHSILDGFTIQNGFANGVQAVSDDDGGGIFINGGAPIIRNCKIRNNIAEHEGGGVAIKSSSLAIIEDCTISNNVAIFGGGLFAYTFEGRIENTVINLNYAEKGGGMRILSSSPDLMNLTISNNEVSDHSGGIYSTSSSFTIEQSRIVKNKSTDMYGGLYAETSSDILIKNCIVALNEGINGGGISNQGSGQLKITN